jgi:hypothetical protein
MRRQTTRAIARARKACNLGGSVGPAPKSERITGEFRNPAERQHGQPWLRPWYMSPRRTEEAAGTQRPDDGPPIVPRVHSIARRADGGPVDEYSGLDPIAREGIRLTARGTTDPEQMAKNADINRGAVLDNLPVVGNYRAGRRALDAAGEFASASHYGHGKRKRRAALAMVLETAGALSPLPWGRSAGRAAAEGADTARIFAGPTAKTADHTALARAQELKASGADRDTIWRETGWAMDEPRGQWYFEIPDNRAYYDGDALPDFRANNRATVDNPATIGEAVGHRDLYKAYPDIEDTSLIMRPSKEMGGAYGGYSRKYNTINLADDINDKNALSYGLHELQHGVQQREGFAPGASHRTYMTERGIDENSARKLYHRTAGEVQARNAESRRTMTPEERRATPPWKTQDVDESDVYYPSSMHENNNVFVPAQPSKTADAAREMRLNDVPNRQIFRQTNRFFGPEGRLKAEVPDKPMVIRRTDMQEGDTAPVGELIDHPGLFGIHPDLREIPVQFTRPNNMAGHPIARTRREGGFEISSGRDEEFYREQFAKLLNYETARKGGFGGAVLHDVHDQFKAYDDALADAMDIVKNPKPGDDVAAASAYIERLWPMRKQLAEGVEAYAGVRDIARRGGANGMDEAMEVSRLRGVTQDATRAANRSTTGNLESRLVRERSHRDVDGGANSLSRYPYEQGVKIGEVGENWSKAQVLPHRGMSRDDTARMIEDWAKYGVGNPRRFARGGRVARAVARGKAVTGGIRGKTGGREDALPVDVPVGAYVIPADVVAALGGGNTEAGMHFLEKRYGWARHQTARRANGGAVPILISDGEYVLSPEAVERAGGNDRLDEMVTRTRNAYAEHLKGLPGPNQ